MSALGKSETEPRDALAAAIRRHTAVTDRLARISAAIENVSVWAATEAVEQAEAILKQARAHEPKKLVARVLGDAVSPGPGVEEAERSLADARTLLGLAQRTRDALESQQRAAESELGWAKSTLKDAIAAVVQAEGGVPKLLADFDAARREVSRLQEILSLLNSRNCLPARSVWDAVVYYPPTNADAPWRTALAALENDADAELP